MKPLAVITGGQRGIGLGIAQALQSAGFRITIVSNNAADEPDVTAAMAGLGQDSVYYQHDIAHIAGHEDILDQIGPISCFVSNAGIAAPVRGDLLDLLPENFDRVMSVNLRGAFFLAQVVARGMLETAADHYRSMIFITSVSAEMVSPERAEYCVSKAGASMMARAFAARLAPENIGVFELRPGIIDTAMTAAVRDTYSSRIDAGLVPARRWGQPKDIGDVVLPLAKGQMAFATGAVIPVDGGLSMHRL